MQKRGLIILIFLVILGIVTYSQNSFFERLKQEKVISNKDILWEQVAPGNSGFANLVRYHPTIEGKVAMCPDMWNAYQSDNNGLRWYSITDPDGDGSFNHLRDLYYSPSNPEFALAICSSELWLSKDTGRTWSIVPNCPWYKPDEEGRDREGWKKKIGSLGIDPNNKDVWFIGGGSNVRGQDWLSCYKDVTFSNPRGKRSPYEGKLWRTTNGGQDWELVNNGIEPRAQIGRIIVNPGNSNQVFVASNYGVYRSDDGGNSWSQISAGKLDNDIIMDMDFYYDPNNQRFILFLIDQVHYLPEGRSTKCTGGIFYSEDEGNSWHKINGNLGLDINRLSGGVPENYYQYIAKWFEISVAEAKSKFSELPTAALQYFNMISTDPSREGAVYIGFADPQVANSIMPGRLWVTEDFGKSWVNTARLYQDAWERDKEYWISRGNPYHENMKVGHSSPHMRFGSNYALRSMRALDVGIDGSVMIISDHSTMLSTDYGKSWRQVDEDYTPSGAILGRGNSNLPGLTIAQDKRFRTTLLGSGEHRLWIPVDDSPDDRQALKFIESAQETVSCLAFDPYDGKTVYATSNRQAHKQNIFRSTDGGWTWENYGVATPASNKWLDDFYTNALTIDPINNQYMYLGITKIVDPKKGHLAGFYYSDDFGKTFKQSNNGLPSPVRINDIQFDPRDESRQSLFVAAEYNNHSYHLPLAEGGLYHSSDRGKSWTKVKLPASVKGVNFIKFDHTNRMYITTGYRGGGDGVWYSDNFGKTWHKVFDYEETVCIDVSPFDHNLIVVTVGFLAKNPGVYFSRDRGKTWMKCNKNIGIPHKIEDIKFDIFSPDQLWVATLGCGFYKGKIVNGKNIQVVDISPEVVDIRNKKSAHLDAKIVVDDFAGKRKIIWKSENPGVAKVNKHGVVSPVGKGNTKIWAMTPDGRFADFAIVTVYDGFAD